MHSPRPRSPRRFRGGRRTEAERATAKCAGETDPISQDEIDPAFAIRLTEGGQTRCWDIRHLQQWFATGSRKNPLTNLDFSATSLAKIQKKIAKMGPAGAALAQAPAFTDHDMHLIVYLMQSHVEDEERMPVQLQLNRRATHFPTRIQTVPSENGYRMLVNSQNHQDGIYVYPNTEAVYLRLRQTIEDLGFEVQHDGQNSTLFEAPFEYGL
jgi:hypothetical protein